VHKHPHALLVLLAAVRKHPHVLLVLFAAALIAVCALKVSSGASTRLTAFEARAFALHECHVLAQVKHAAWQESERQLLDATERVIFLERKVWELEHPAKKVRP
jgi:hypothetical protein